MVSYADASRTKDFFENQLFANHPTIVSIAPELKQNENGQFTDEGVIVIIVTAADLTIPDSLPVPPLLNGVDKNVDRNNKVKTIVKLGSLPRVESNTSWKRPCPGGFSISHFSVSSGTLGCAAKVEGDWNFVLGCNHTLAASNSGTIGDVILQPGKSHDGPQIGRLYGYVEIDFYGNNEVDCALAEVTDGDEPLFDKNVKDVGIVEHVDDAIPAQEIRKSGYNTELTTGQILSDNATTQVGLGGQKVSFVNQLKYTNIGKDGSHSPMTWKGDSGALIWDKYELTALGLHFARHDEYSYGNKVLRVIECLNSSLGVNISILD